MDEPVKATRGEGGGVNAICNHPGCSFRAATLEEMNEHAKKHHCPREPHWSEECEVELKLTAKLVGLITQLIHERDKAKFSESDNRKLDKWPLVFIKRDSKGSGKPHAEGG